MARFNGFSDFVLGIDSAIIYEIKSLKLNMDNMIINTKIRIIWQNSDGMGRFIK